VLWWGGGGVRVLVVCNKQVCCCLVQTNKVFACNKQVTQLGVCRARYIGMYVIPVVDGFTLFVGGLFGDCVWLVAAESGWLWKGGGKCVTQCRGREL
jgi:hypothetical protein